MLSNPTKMNERNTILEKTTIDRWQDQEQYYEETTSQRQQEKKNKAQRIQNNINITI